MQVTIAGNNKPQDAFARARYKYWSQWGGSNGEEKERTFAMDPQKRRRLPLFENTALEEPGRRSLVVGLTCDVMICRGIRRREPLLQFLW